MSLWRIADEPTSRLMTDYYRRLRDGGRCAEALLMAQRAMLSNASHAHPFYWAGFVPVGDDHALRLPDGTSTAPASAGDPGS